MEKNYEANGDAKHYSENRLQSIIKFERTYGTLAVMTFCEITADKYRERLGKKIGQPIEQDLVKMQWYEKAAKFFFNKLGKSLEIIIDNRRAEPLPWDNKDEKPELQPKLKPIEKTKEEDTDWPSIAPE